MLAVCFAAIGLFAVATAAKRAQYEPGNSSARILAKAVKMRADCDDSVTTGGMPLGVETGAAVPDDSQPVAVRAARPRPVSPPLRL